ncbi:MAG: TrmH family RNA methyltransferase [Pyrinomonadaceae bacterium]
MQEFEPITSRDNRRLVNARKVRDGKTSDLIFIEGKRLAEEALRSHVEIVECFVSDDFADESEVAAIKRQSALVAVVSRELFGTIADTDSPQGIILIAKRPPMSPDFDAGDAQLPLAISLSEINNPSNLGAVLRSAEAAGVTRVLISKDSADPFSPKALRASMGSAFRLNISTGCEFADVLKYAAENRFRTVGADASGTTNYTDVDWKIPRILVIGSEAHGLSAEQKASLDELACIPMTNGVESLNLAVSVGVILFEAKRQNS